MSVSYSKSDTYRVAFIGLERSTWYTIAISLPLFLMMITCIMSNQSIRGSLFL